MACHNSFNGGRPHNTSTQMNTSIRSDLKAAAFFFGLALAFFTVDVAAQHALLECEHRAPAIARMCR